MTQLLTIPEVCERMQVSRRTVYRLIAERRLRVTKVRGLTRFTEAEVERYLTLAQRKGVA